MDLFFNELSFHGQFRESQDAYAAIERVARLRSIVRSHGLMLRCGRDLDQRLALGQACVAELVRRWPDRQKKQAFMAWVSREGPFLDDDPLHEPGQWLERVGVADEPITETGLGQAAWRVHCGRMAATVSVSPSNQCQSPLGVVWRPDDLGRDQIDVQNYWEESGLHERLAGVRPPQSWVDLREWTERSCPHLTIAPDAFHSLEGQPYHVAAARRFQSLLSVLNRLKTCFEGDGTPSAEWHQLFREWFAGGEHFSDASPTELMTMSDEMRFPDPDRPGEQKVFSWHGKVNTPKFRVHFSWPITRDSKLHIVYLGPKLTRR